MNTTFPPINVFYSYADADKDLCRELDNHLSHLRNTGLITTWDRRAITAGSETLQIRHQHLNNASIILLLVSSDFVSSQYCYGTEMPQAMQRHDAKKTLVIPILLRPVDWEDTPFGKLDVLPSDKTPITQWVNRDAAFVDIVQGIRAALSSIQVQAPSDVETPSTIAPQEEDSRPTQKKGFLQRPVNILIIVVLFAILFFLLRGLLEQQKPSFPYPSPVSSSVSTLHFHEFKLPTKNSNPISLISGHDGNLWFIEYEGNKIGRITPQGKIIEYPIPTPSSNAFRITCCERNGNLWFIERASKKIGRITPQGIITEFSVPSAKSLAGITIGQDGNIWFTDVDANEIGQMTPDGVPTGKFEITTKDSGPQIIIAGPDGNLWFTEVKARKIGRITTQGIIKELPLLANASFVSLAPEDYHTFLVGPDHNIWFTEGPSYKIGRITPDNTVAEFPVPPEKGYIGLMSIGPDGNLWLYSETHYLANMTTEGKIVNRFPVPESLINSLILGPDNHLWVSEYSRNAIGYFDSL